MHPMNNIKFIQYTVISFSGRHLCVGQEASADPKTFFEVHLHYFFPEVYDIILCYSVLSLSFSRPPPIPFCISQYSLLCSHHQIHVFLFTRVLIIFVNCHWVVTRWQWLFYMYTNMEKKVTREFKSGGLHERHVVATWKLGNHLSIRL